MTGEYIEKEKRITKPCHLGAFVLSYSRSIMLIYMRAIDPTLKTHIMTYTDTDSMHIMGKYAEKLYEMGYIKDKNNSKLGYLCSDIKKEGSKEVVKNKQTVKVEEGTSDDKLKKLLTPLESTDKKSGGYKYFNLQKYIKHLFYK